MFADDAAEHTVLCESGFPSHFHAGALSCTPPNNHDIKGSTGPPEKPCEGLIQKNQYLTLSLHKTTTHMY
jgi:hypothetical protein